MAHIIVLQRQSCLPDSYDMPWLKGMKLRFCITEGMAISRMKSEQYLGTRSPSDSLGEATLKGTVCDNAEDALLFKSYR